MNHSKATGLALYGRSVASFQGVRADIQTALISFSQRWHTYLGLSPDQLILGSLFYNRDFLIPKIEVGPSLPQPSQPLPGLALPLDRPVVQFCYPINPMATAPSHRVSIGQFNELIGLYRLPQTGQSADLNQLADLTQSDDLDQGQVIRQLAYSPLQASQVDSGLLTLLLREFLADDQAVFRSPEQQEAFYLILKHIPYLFLILPTAAGKTTLFLFGASLAPAQVTIVVIPLISLKLDLFGKAKALGLRPTVWGPATSYQTIDPDCRVILIQIEYITHSGVLEMANHLISQKKLARVIWDECHLIPLSQSYRLIMRRAWHALALPVPMVFSSATLPSHLQSELSQMLCLGTTPHVLRADLTLKNMAYRVEALPKALDQADYPGYLTQFIKQFEYKHSPFGPRVRAKVIIFCYSKALVNQLFNALQPQVARFHSDLAEDEKLTQLALFRGDILLLVATSGIGAGYDFPDIDLVIHFMPKAYEITNFMQESGRAGRSPDRKAWSYCLVQPYQLQQSTSQGQQAPAEKIYFQQYLVDQICRRRVISRVFNAKALESCDPSWAQCDCCTRRLATLSSVGQTVRQLEGENWRQIEFFARAVKFWTDKRYVVCYLG